MSKVPLFPVGLFRILAKSQFFPVGLFRILAKSRFFQWVSLGNEQSPGFSGGFIWEMSKVPVLRWVPVFPVGLVSLGNEPSPCFSGGFLLGNKQNP